MATKQRIKIVSIAGLLVLSILILAQSFYQKNWIDKDLIGMSQAVPGIAAAKIITTNTGKELNIVTGMINNLPESTRQLEAIAGKIPIRFLDRRNDLLEQVFQQMQFALQEGIISGRFTEMETHVQELAAKANVKVDIAMDSEYIYVSLIQNEAQLVEILDRKNSGRFLPSEGEEKT